jgi:hypothetical protein
MNIGIFDPEHYETTYALIRLADLPHNRIIIFTDERCKKRLEEFNSVSCDNVKWVVRAENESHPSFIRRMNREIRLQNIHFLFYNTISNNHLLHALLLKMNPFLRCIITIHDINDMFAPASGISPRKILRAVGKKMLLKGSHELNVISDTLVPYLKEKAGNAHVIHNIPGAVFESEPFQPALTGKIKLVIPGTIDKKRKDILEAYELLIKADAMKLPLELILLGAPLGEYGQDMLNISRNLTLKHCTIRTFEHEIPQYEFDKQVQESHFIFIPSVRKSREKGKPAEIYGITKCSGGIFDAVRHAKPIIIPFFLQVPSNIERSCIRYSNIIQLAAHLDELYKNRDQYVKWQGNALESSMHYTIENIRQQNPGLFM